MKNKDEVDALRRLVQSKDSKVEANEEKPHEKPLPPKPRKNYAGKKMDDSKSPAHRYMHDVLSNINIFPRSKKQTLLCHHLLLWFRANSDLIINN